MNYEDYLQSEAQKVKLPYLFGNRVIDLDRSYRTKNLDEGWYEFEITGRNAKPIKKVESEIQEYDGLRERRGYLFGKQLINNEKSTRVYCLPDVEKFTPVLVKEWFDGSFVYSGNQFETEVELAVRSAFEDRTGIEHIKGVIPDLAQAFIMYSFDREQARIQKALLDRKQWEEEQKRTVKGRLEYALQHTGSELLAYTEIRCGGYTVRFKFMNRKFECVVDNNLRIVDAGVCLKDSRTGEDGSRKLTMESLPSAIKEATVTNRLHIFRHVDGEDYDDED